MFLGLVRSTLSALHTLSLIPSRRWPAASLGAGLVPHPLVGVTVLRDYVEICPAKSQPLPLSILHSLYYPLSRMNVLNTHRWCWADIVSSSSSQNSGFGRMSHSKRESKHQSMNDQIWASRSSLWLLNCKSCSYISNITSCHSWTLLWCYQSFYVFFPMMSSDNRFN